jgi:eukaryotic-like serine/threonine-protein kinase
LEIFTKEKFKALKPYLIVLSSFIGALFLLFIILDWYILPNYVQNIDKTKVPDVSGKSLTEATEILSQNKLYVKKTGTQYSEDFPSNTVISQNPKPGMLVKQGRHVSLTVSLGKESISTPKILGLPISAAREIVSRLKIIGVGNITYVSSDSIGADTIISQFPYPGAPINAGSSVNIVVSRGPENPIKVASLIGRHIQDAERIIEESGLKVGMITYVVNETYQPSTVIGQTPPAGEIVKKATEVNLTVTRK